MKVYSALYMEDAHLMQLPTATEFSGVTSPSELVEEDSILILHGGSDISPSIYGELPNSRTMAGEKLSHRDEMEVALAREAFRKRIPIFGICRGAQLLCALNGGKLVQHVNGHSGTPHLIDTVDKKTFTTNSYHHQMMNPQGTEHELLAWASTPRSNVYLGAPGETINMFKEPEMIYFPKLRAIGVQGHPEWATLESNLVTYCLSKIQEKLL